MSPRIPIFVLTFNRLWCTEPCFRSLQALEPAAKLIIVDHGSTYPPLLRWLVKKAKQGYRVIRKRPLQKKDDLYASIRKTVGRWMAAQRTPPPLWGVTDSDVVLERPNPVALRKLVRFAQSRPKTKVFGCMLRVDDLPDHYPLKREMQTNKRWGKPWFKKPILRDGKTGIRYSTGVGFDTPLAFYPRRMVSKKRGGKTVGIGLRGAFVAKHLDWYLDPHNLNEDQMNYLRTVKAMSHYGSHRLRKFIGLPKVYNRGVLIRNPAKPRPATKKKKTGKATH